MGDDHRFTARARQRSFRMLRSSCAFALLPILFGALIAIPDASSAASCLTAQNVFVYPDTIPATNPAIETLSATFAEELQDPIGVCTEKELAERSASAPIRNVFALGDRVAAEAARKFPSADTIPMLVTTLPANTTRGVSIYVSPFAVIERVCSMFVDIEGVEFIHRSSVPNYVLVHLDEAAKRCSLKVTRTRVDTISEAAKAVENALRNPRKRVAVWFNRGVIELNADLLIPNIVRFSWSNGASVIAEDAEYIKRGILVGFFQDYRYVARKAIALSRDKAKQGLVYAEMPKSALNKRTSNALGLSRKSTMDETFDHVYK